MSKYKPLKEHLMRRGDAQWRASFAELEALLGFALPKTARTSGAWWSNAGAKPHQKAWLEPGWDAEADRAAETVVFRRRGGGAVPANVAEAAGVGDGKPERKMSKAVAFGAAAAVAGLGAMLLRALRRR